jgi:hypothetical protein
MYLHLPHFFFLRLTSLSVEMMAPNGKPLSQQCTSSDTGGGRRHDCGMAVVTTQLVDAIL